ncbi:hypothetical protein IGI04_042534 [Brassica rapa subsp. trilocularis]|uniref:histone acetyltransferase n=1 Tax=Brassica rapa subsp. trilocularis TaxID=1813537 RepID=A0ABQ7KJ19_BRACM|nr:hypothetical protein IGI04_042534 [Brassica rapa subsp. trilocularis]
MMARVMKVMARAPVDDGGGRRWPDNALERRELVATGLGKCSLCNKDDQDCAACGIETCNYSICNNCFRTGKFGLLELHLLDKDNYKKSYDLWLSTLEHLSSCVPTPDQPCMSVKCSLARDLMMHLKDCNRRIDGGCKRCKQIWVGMSVHASHCSLPNCNISFCRSISEFKRTVN